MCVVQSGLPPAGAGAGLLPVGSVPLGIVGDVGSLIRVSVLLAAIIQDDAPVVRGGMGGEVEKPLDLQEQPALAFAVGRRVRVPWYVRGTRADRLAPVGQDPLTWLGREHRVQIGDVSLELFFSLVDHYISLGVASGVAPCICVIADIAGANPFAASAAPRICCCC